MFGFEESSSIASGEKCGAMMTSQNCFSSASANCASTARLTAMTPPNADSGSHAKAAW